MVGIGHIFAKPWFDRKENGLRVKGSKDGDACMARSTCVGDFCDARSTYAGGVCWTFSADGGNFFTGQTQVWWYRITQELDWNSKDFCNLRSHMGLIWCRVTTNSLCESWNGVTEKTIVNCWRKSGLCLGPEGSWSCWSWNPWKIEWIRRREYLIRRREYLVKRREYLLPHAKWARPSEMIFGSFGAVLDNGDGDGDTIGA